MKKYYSKLLLFGEYTIILGGQALALPLPHFSCHWTQEGDGTESKSALRHFYLYLRKLENQKVLKEVLDLKRMAADLKANFFLQSNIPLGYGLGSSGALCAAVYDRYALNKISRDAEESYPDLRHILGLMESHFHGASSGVDPLICYLNQPVLIKPLAEIEQVSTALPTEEAPMQLFLLDTKTPRQTGPLVNRFLQKCEDKAYERLIENELIPETEAAINAFLQRQWSDLFSLMHTISHFQWKHFREMIPEPYQNTWIDGLNSAHFKLKLCGAGGGGFLLGLTNDTAMLRLSDDDIMML